VADPLCVNFVFSVSLWRMFTQQIHHKDTKVTKTATENKPSRSKLMIVGDSE